MANGIKILGIGAYIPDIVVTNDEFGKYIETSDEWIKTRTGISERRFCGGKANFQMATAAAEIALADAKVSPLDIDCVIVSTTTPDFYYPSVAALVSKEVGADNAFAFDVSAACTGFVYAMDIARSYLALGKYKKVLVIASELLSPQVDFTDRSTCVLFGDGAGAAVVEANADNGYASFLGTDGESFPDAALYCRANYENNSPFTKDCPDPFENFKDNKGKYIQMNGRLVYEFAAKKLPFCVNKVCGEVGIKPSEIDLLIPHQANIRIINAAMKSLDIPQERVFINIDRRGNSSSACVPTCIYEAVGQGRLKRGDKVVIVAFGGGLTYGALYLEF